MNLHLEDFKKYIFRKIYIIFTMLLLGVGLSVLALGEKFTFNKKLWMRIIFRDENCFPPKLILVF